MQPHVERKEACAAGVLGRQVPGRGRAFATHTPPRKICHLTRQQAQALELKGSTFYRPPQGHLHSSKNQWYILFRKPQSLTPPPVLSATLESNGKLTTNVEKKWQKISGALGARLLLWFLTTPGEGVRTKKNNQSVTQKSKSPPRRFSHLSWRPRAGADLLQ